MCVVVCFENEIRRIVKQGVGNGYQEAPASSGQPRAKVKKCTQRHAASSLEAAIAKGSRVLDAVHALTRRRLQAKRRKLRPRLILVSASRSVAVVVLRRRRCVIAVPVDLVLGIGRGQLLQLTTQLRILVSQRSVIPALTLILLLTQVQRAIQLVDNFRQTLVLGNGCGTVSQALASWSSTTYPWSKSPTCSPWIRALAASDHADSQRAPSSRCGVFSPPACG